MTSEGSHVTTAFSNPTATNLSDVPLSTVNNGDQHGDTGQLPTVVVVPPPPTGDIAAGGPAGDQFELELQKTSNCAWATLGTCFWPISIVAIVYANKAKSALKAGNRTKAEKYDSLATKLSCSSCLIGTVLWIVGLSVYIYYQTAY